MNCDEAAKLIGPYLDGELDLPACVKIEEHLATCEACQRKAESHTTLTSVLQEHAPEFKPSPFLATRIRASIRGEEPAAKSWWQMIPTTSIFSALLGTMAVLAVAVYLSLSAPPSRLAQEAITDHVRSLQVNHLMDVASTDQHTVKPWFAGKLDYSPQVIDLGPSGYPLIGGRLDVLDQRNVAAMIYQRRKHYINLFEWPADKASVGDTSYEQDGYHVIAWTKNGMNYLAVSELGVKELKDFAGMIKDQIVPPME